MQEYAEERSIYIQDVLTMHVGEILCRMYACDECPQIDMELNSEANDAVGHGGRSRTRTEVSKENAGPGSRKSIVARDQDQIEIQSK